MKSIELKPLPEFSCTYPLTDNRIEAIKLAIPEMDVYKPVK